MVVLAVIVVVEQDVVSKASPSQAEGEGALQLRILNLTPQEHSGLQADHSPQSDQTPKPGHNTDEEWGITTISEFVWSSSSIFWNYMKNTCC